MIVVVVLVVKMIYKLCDKALHKAGPRANGRSFAATLFAESLTSRMQRQKVREICDSCVVNG